MKTTQSPEEIEASYEESQEFNARLRQAKVRETADRFSFAALAFCAFGILSAFWGLSQMVQGNSAEGFYFAGGLGGMGLFLYLIAQVIYIRANTEK